MIPNCGDENALLNLKMEIQRAKVQQYENEIKMKATMMDMQLELYKLQAEAFKYRILAEAKNRGIDIGTIGFDKE